ncbi:MAG: hypothetical protein GF418_13745 [Chitinivibrionales bacterium]|nr:hypothetical protein [Chitinivibrionales bacterium]MBD3396684.1 hypothetical protein [Chitinivibrionales bacterium]
MKKIVLLAGAAAIAAFFIVRMIMPDDRVRIERTITRGRDAIEREDIDDLMKVVSLTYRGQSGLSYLTLRRMFERLFESSDRITAGCRFAGIDISGDTADAVLDVWLSGMVDGQRYRIIGSATAPERLTVILAKGELKWAVVATKWDRVPSVETMLEFGRMRRVE